MTRDIQYIVIHCTAGSKNQTAASLRKFFITPTDKGGRGWKRGGYHYIVQGDGTVSHEIDDDKISNGVAGKNSICINVSYCGGIQQDANGKNCKPNIAKDTRTPEQKKALAELVADLKRKYPKAEVVGHHHFAQKACPSFDAGSEYGGIPASKKAKDYGKAVNATIASRASSGKPTYATVSQIKQYKLAYESIGKSLTEYPDTIINSLNSLVDTYNSIVETSKNLSKELPIPDIPDPTELIKQKITDLKNAGKDFTEEGAILIDTVIPVPDGTEIEEENSFQNLLDEMGIIGVLKDLISPVTDFIKDAPLIIDDVISGTKKTISGTIQGVTTASGMIVSDLDKYKPSEDEDSEDTEKKNLLDSALDIADTGMEYFGKGMESLTTDVTSVVGMVTSVAEGVLETGLEVTSGIYGLAMGSVGAVGGMVAKIPTVLPKVISYALSYAIKKAKHEADVLAKTANSAVNSATNSTLNGVSEDDIDEDFDDAMATNYIEETSPEFVKPETLISPVSDSISNIYQDEYKKAIGNVSESDIDSYNTNIDSNQINQINIDSNQINNQIQDTEEIDSIDGLFDNIGETLKDSLAAAENEISNSMAEYSSASADKPHFESTEKDELIENIASNNSTVQKLEDQFRNTFIDISEIESESVLKLYSEIRKGLLEIMPDLSEDVKTNEMYVNMASFATLKITPAMIEYINKKFETFEQKINTYIDEKIAALNTTTIRNINTIT